MCIRDSLFGAPEPAAPTAPTSEPEAASHDLSDDELSADAAARPRQRQATASEASSDSPAANDSEPSSDEPAWAHHSQLDPLQLTPMLRHYVELKAAHPERVLLYRLGDFFECFFEDAIELSRVWSSPSPARRAAKPSAGCRWRASPTTPLSLSLIHI